MVAGAMAVGAAGAMAAGATVAFATADGETVGSAMAAGEMVAELAGQMVVPESPFAGEAAAGESTNLLPPLNSFDDEH